MKVVTLTRGIRRLLGVLTVCAVVNMWRWRLLQAWDVESILGRRRLLLILRTTLRMIWRTRRCSMLHLRRRELEGEAVVRRLLEPIVHVAPNV